MLRALDRGATRVVAVWHRRAGKEKTFLNYMAKKTAERVGSYYYLFPEYKQAKKAIWEGMDKDGFPFLSHFPADYIKSRNESDLKLHLNSGSIFQLAGSDNYDGLMSTNPIGVVFAEYSLHDPRAWDYFRPILRENGGWAIFDYTPRGKNHGHAMFELATKLMQEGDPAWFCQRLTIHDTGVLTDADMEAERREGMDEEMIQQEYFCSFEGVQQGSIFGRQMDVADRESRVCGVPWQPEFPVSTWWDIGTGDATAIWFTQDVGREVHVIDYYENSGVGIGIDHYVKVIKEKPYLYAAHTGPHDMEAHSFAANGKSAREVAAVLGLKFEIAPRVDRHDGILAARSFLARCWFDRAKTERGRLALQSYHYTWDDRRKMFTKEPYHDWASNAADAMRYLAISHKPSSPYQKAESDRWKTGNRAGNGSASAWMGV